MALRSSLASSSLEACFQASKAPSYNIVCHDLKYNSTIPPRGHVNHELRNEITFWKSWKLQNPSIPRRDLRSHLYEVPPNAPRDTVPCLFFSSFYQFYLSCCLYLVFLPFSSGIDREPSGLGKLMMDMRNLVGRTEAPEGINTFWELARPISQGKRFCIPEV